MPDYVTRTLRCPLCATEFVVDELRGGSPIDRDSDLRPVHEGADPLLSSLHACPGCLYSAHGDGFHGEDPSEDDAAAFLSDDEWDLLPRPPPPIPDPASLPELRRFTASADFKAGLADPFNPFGAERYRLAARLYEFLRDDPRGTAHFFLRAAWCSRLAGERAAEVDALHEVGVRLAGVLERGSVDARESVRLSYLAAECARRSGDFSRAVDLFSDLERTIDPEDPDDPQAGLLLALAHRQGMLARMRSAVNVRLGDLEEVLERSGARPGEHVRDDESLD